VLQRLGAPHDRVYGVDRHVDGLGARHGRDGRRIGRVHGCAGAVAERHFMAAAVRVVVLSRCAAAAELALERRRDLGRAHVVATGKLELVAEHAQ
jgi:hypothetical protein